MKVIWEPDPRLVRARRLQLTALVAAWIGVVSLLAYVPIASLAGA